MVDLDLPVSRVAATPTQANDTREPLPDRIGYASRIRIGERDRRAATGSASPMDTPEESFLHDLEPRLSRGTRLPAGRLDAMRGWTETDLRRHVTTRVPVTHSLKASI